MITNTAGTTIVLNQNTTYSSVTGLWTLVSPHALFNSGLLNFGRPLVGKMVKSSSVSLLPSGSADSAIYYVFKVGNTIGLAATLEDASNNVPVKFYTSGQLFLFVQAGKTYRLKPQNLECCKEEIFNTQLPPPYNTDLNSLFEMPGPEKIRKKISFSISGVGVTGYAGGVFLNMGDINSFATIVNGTYDLYVGNNTYSFVKVTTSFGDTYPITRVTSGGGPLPMLSYNNTKHKIDNLYSSIIIATLEIKLVRNESTLEVTAFYNLILDGTADAGHNVMYAFYSGSIVFTNFASISAGDVFDTIPILNLVTISGYFGPWPATLTPVFSGDYVSELLPATITLERSYEQHLKTKLERPSGSNYPIREWTTNDYSLDLPETIVLNKISGRNYESAPFTLAVNIINKIKLKLMVLPSNSFGEGGFNYVFFDRYFTQINGKNSNNYLTSYRPLQFYKTPPSTYAHDGSWFYNTPAGFKSGIVSLVLFRESGILAENSTAPTAPQVSECFAFVNYKITVGGPPYIPLRKEVATFVSRTGTGILIGVTSGSDGNSGLIMADGTTQTFTLITIVSGTLKYNISVFAFDGSPTASISLNNIVLQTINGSGSQFSGTSPVSVGQTIVFAFNATAPTGRFNFKMSIV